jgi:hypothetical protein
MSEDFMRANNTLLLHEAKNIALFEVMTLLRGNGIKFEDIGLPMPTPLSEAHLAMCHLIGELAFDVIEEQRSRITFSAQLNERQRVIFDLVETALINKAPLNIFVDGRGGTGKTFLYKAICSLVRSLGKIVIPVAWSGIAAILMPGGQTCHARFGLKVPFERGPNSTSRIRGKQRFQNSIIFSVQI